MEYIPIADERPRKWLPWAAVAISATVGAIVGLRIGQPSSSLHAVTTPVATRVQTMSMPQVSRRNPIAAYSENDFDGDVVQRDAPELEATTLEQPSAISWMGLGIIPVAAALGFLVGSRTSTPKVSMEPFEVVIGSDEPDMDIAMAATTGDKAHLYAVVAIGGHQYLVQPGEILSIDKLPLEVGDEFTFDKVLLVKDGEKVDVGYPYLSNAKVTAEVLRNSKGRKIRVYKYRSKKHTRLTKGHRQKYTDIHITEVAGHKVASKVNFAALSAPQDVLVKA